MSFIHPDDNFLSRLWGKVGVSLLTDTAGVPASRWVRCNTERIHPGVEYWVTQLLQGCEYEFRVSAENEVGAGDPSPPSKPVFAKDPIGQFAHGNMLSLHLCRPLISSPVAAVKPGPPVDLQAVDFTKESVTLSWQPPSNTGRGKIFGYLLEFQKAGEEEWTKVRSRWCRLVQHETPSR